MPIRCDDAQARMMDLLYGELAGDDRAAVEAHVGGCGRCQAELAGFQRTRATVRGALEQSPPARAREIILRAATAQTAALAAARAAAEKPVRPPVPPPRISIGEWLRRRWAVPTLATIGAVAVFLLASKMFLQPAKFLQTAPKDDSVIGELAEKAAPAAAQAPAPSPAAPRPVASAAAPPVSPVTAVPERLEAAKPSTWRASGAPGAAQLDHIARNRTMAKKTAVGKVNREDEGAGSPAVAAASDKSEPAARFAAPPPPRAPAKAALENLATEELAAEKESLRKEAQAASNRASTAAAPAGAAPRRAAAEPEEDSAPLAALSDESAGRRKASKRKAATDEPAETPVQRADRLFAKARWAEAAVAYRRLLQHEPDSADAPRWRQRLAVAEKNAHENTGLEPTP
jgi:Putative zinc-finger